MRLRDFKYPLDVSDMFTHPYNQHRRPAKLKFMEKFMFLLTLITYNYRCNNALNAFSC